MNKKRDWVALEARRIERARLLKRCHHNQAAVAQANKTAHIACGCSRTITTTGPRLHVTRRRSRPDSRPRESGNG